MPMRRPVNEPGPAPIATASSSRGAMPAARHASSIGDQQVGGAADACRASALASTRRRRRRARCSPSASPYRGRGSSPGEEPHDVVARARAAMMSTIRTRPTCWMRSRAFARQRPAPRALDREHEQVAAVEHRDRQQVDEAEVDADQREHAAGSCPSPGCRRRDATRYIISGPPSASLGVSPPRIWKKPRDHRARSSRRCARPPCSSRSRSGPRSRPSRRCRDRRRCARRTRGA